MLTNFLRVGMAAAAIVLATTTLAPAETSATPVKPAVVAQASPAPTSSPNPFTYRGYVRAYYFTRQNATAQKGGTGQTNQASFAPAISLHGEYKFGSSPISVGATYLYASPLNGCTSPTSHLSTPCGKNSPPALNPDDTLPGFELSTLYEAYLQFKDPALTAKVGNQVYNQPWANASDSRLKPAAFQGFDAVGNFNSEFNAQLSWMWQYQNRTSSSFTQNTLITSYPAGNPGLPANFWYQGGNGVTTPGMLYARVGYNDVGVAHPSRGSTSSSAEAGKTMVVSNGGLTVDLADYGFINLANMLWLDGKYTFGDMKYQPFVAIQAATENNTGSAVLGKISSTVFGAQLGASVTPNVLVAASYDNVPWRNSTFTLGTGVSCNSSNQIKTKKTFTLPYFLPSNAPECVTNANGTTTVYYGGIASPYTDGYATDPMFTTSLTQGQADRRSPGSSFKAAVTFATSDKHFIASFSQAWYTYGNAIGSQNTGESDVDAQYFLEHVPKTGRYKGFSLRYRYGDRYYSSVKYGGLPDFKYNRFQAEYDF